MKRLSAPMRILAALSLTLSMLAALAIPTSAAPNPSGVPPAEWDGSTYPRLTGYFNELYFPAVGNADESTGLGAAQTSITVQSTQGQDAYLFVFVGQPENDNGVNISNWEVVEYAYLSAGASKTFLASDLEIPAGDVRPVAVTAYHSLGVRDGDTLALIAGVAKQAVGGDSLPFTTSTDSAVSGYNAIAGTEQSEFDQLYFPIVQTNCGPGGCWNSILRIANLGDDDNAAVTVRFFPADDGSGSLQTGFQLQGLVDAGETWSIDLSEWVPEGWVGSAHVYTDDTVGAIVDRIKVGTDMWITNTASHAYAEGLWQIPGSGSYPYVLFAPDVRTDYNGWNTGINVANTVDFDTNVSIQYFGANGNAPAAQTRRLAAHGMTYFYNPSDPSEDRCQQPATDVPGCEFIGGAIILSSNPVAVAVDGVKYFGAGNDANVGQAFSYSATANAYDVQAAALVQKGNPATGVGATSGINFLNPNASATVVETTWLNPSGFGAANFGSSIVWVPGFATGFVYTMFHHNLPNGYVGSAIVTSDLPIAATTANVDYQVSGDGTATFNLSNPCGNFRQTLNCVFESPTDPLPVSATLTKEVAVDDPFNDDDDMEPLAGVLVAYNGVDEHGVPVSGNGFTGANGSVTFAVPAGTYDITLVTLPAAPDGFVYSGPMTDTGNVVAMNGATTVTNLLSMEIAEGTGTLTKNLIVGKYHNLESEVYFCTGFPWDLSECLPTAVVSAGYGEGGNAINQVSAQVPAGQYAICTNVTVTINSDTLYSEGCEWAYEVDGEMVPILVLDGQETIVNNVFDEQTDGSLDVYVRDDETDTAVANVQICVTRQGSDLTLCGTSSDGQLSTGGMAGTYIITASHPDYEQETVVFTYSPTADTLDGGLLDFYADADVVISLDPLVPEVRTGVLDVRATMGGEPLTAEAINVYAAADGDSTDGCLSGDIVASGVTSGSPLFLYSVTLPAGDYCLQMPQGGGAAALFTLEADNPADNIDVSMEIGNGG